MPRCPACRLTVPADLATCPGCAGTLLAPGLGRPDDASPPEGSLAPALPSGLRVHPEADLAAAIAEAPEGGVLELPAGVFRLRRGLHLTRAITLNGAGPGRTRIVSAAPAYVLRVLEGGLLRARGVAFEHEGRATADVLVAEAGELDLADCLIAGGHTDAFPRDPGGATGPDPARRERHGRGLVVAGSARATLARCAFERNLGDGLAVLDDAAASLRGWTSRGNRGLGALAAGRAWLDLRDGEAVMNYLGGVAFRDDARGEVRQARCVRGGGFGIALFHRATVAIAVATLSDNGRSGLAYWHRSGGTARGCTVERNGEHGIEVRDDAAPTLEGNRVRGNRAWGLVFADRSRGVRADNVVEGNMHGDVRILDAAAPDRP